MTPLVGDLIESTVGKVVGGLVDKYLPKSMGEAEKASFVQEAQRLSVATYKAETKDIQSARAMQMSVLQNAPRWIKAASAVVIPYGGIMAITVFFWNILAPYFGYIKVPLTVHEAMTIDGIIMFFFGYRLTQKLKGTAGKF
jgi:hypothetical protein